MVFVANSTISYRPAIGERFLYRAHYAEKRLQKREMYVHYHADTAIPV